ncbi:MAG: inositol monophosphatase family protein [Ruminococcus sp.]
MTHEKVTEKGAADYVTNVDVAVQNYLKEALEKEFPNIAADCRREREPWTEFRKSYWILDPIDGTTNLIRDYHLSAVSLGLYENGEITFGVVYNPFTEELFYGAKGEGAYLERNSYPCVRPAGIQRCCCVFRFLSL